jgi:hypothetical protein
MKTLTIVNIARRKKVMLKDIIEGLHLKMSEMDDTIVVITIDHLLATLNDVTEVAVETKINNSSLKLSPSLPSKPKQK